MTRRVSFFGSAAPGLAAGSEPAVGDLLDLLDERIYRTSWPDDPYELQYAGIAGLIAGCGAWVEEIVRIDVTDIAVRNVPPGANLAADDLADNGISLGWEDSRRRVWVPEVVRMTLTRVTGRIAPAGGCTRLFMRRDGTPMTRQEITDKLGSVCERIGIGRFGLPMRLLALFEDRISTCGDDLAADFLCRRLAAMRRALADGGAGEPTLVQLRKAVESVHLIGRLTRDMLQHVKPLERAYPNRAFRQLSPQAEADIVAARQDPHRHCYPHELLDAVFAALDSGRHEREIAAHYGIPPTVVHNWTPRHRRASHRSGPRRAGLGPRSRKEAFLAHARRHPRKTLTQVKSWLEGQTGVLTEVRPLQSLARNNGVKLANPQSYLRAGRDPQRLEAHIRKNPQVNALDVQGWAKETLKRDLSLGAILRFARSRGLRLARRPDLSDRTGVGGHAPKLDEAKAAKLEAYVRTNPEADIHDVMAFIERELKISLVAGTIYQFLTERGLKTRKLAPGFKAPYGPALLAWVAAHPDAEFLEALAWLEGELGKKMHPNTVWGFLDSRGIRLRPPKYANCSKIAGEHAAAIAAYVVATPEADIHDLRDWIKWTLKTEVSLGILYLFLRRRGLKTRKLPPGPRPSRSRIA